MKRYDIMNNAIISHWLYGPALYDFALYVPVNKWTLLNRQPSSAWLKDPSGILRGNRKMKTGSSGSAKSTGKTSPRTGDPSNPMLWIVLLILSIAGVVGLAVWRRRHKAWPGILSVFRELWCRNREFIGSCKATFDKKADLSAEIWLWGARSGSHVYRKPEQYLCSMRKLELLQSVCCGASAFSIYLPARLGHDDLHACRDRPG